MADYHKTVDGIDVRGGIAPNDIPVEVRDKHYVHTQTEGAEEWRIEHRLSKVPSVTIVDRYDRVIMGEIIFNTPEWTIIKFSYAIDGKAFLN